MAKLTEDMVAARTRQSNLSSVIKLNCWGSELSDISLLQKLVNVEVLSFSVNKISSLADFQNCLKLQELFVRKNEIRDLNQICYLKQLPKLRVLNLAENPCSYKEGYRLAVINCLPKLEKLDDKQITQEELRDAMRLGKELIHPEANEICESPDRIEYEEDNGSEDEYFTNQNILPVSKKVSPSDEEYYSPRDGNTYIPDSHQSSRTNLYHSQSESLDHDERSVGYSDHGEENNVANSPNCLVEDYIHSSPPRTTPLHTSYLKEENNYPNHRHSVHEEVETSTPPLPRMHPLTRSRTVDSVGEVSPRMETYGICDRSCHYKQLSSEHPLHRTRHRPVTRNSNILNAVLCLVKELDYQSLEVADMAIRCRMDELDI
uniref:U2A'/phosphoprotein 32 family A C-terminal domain-containing protein n=1 Tax=Clastoptera arizonana TaxID=38151 RepID=A0A1B6C5R7_9HEMI